MARKKSDGPVVSMSGAPIYRHSEATPWEAPRGEVCLDQISEHVETHLGEVATVFHEIVSDAVHIDILFVNPTSAFPFYRLVTSGMSDLPMVTPEEDDIPRFVELLATLPAKWRLDQKSFKKETWYWPVRLLKGLARMPHKYQTWLGWGHTVPNGDPPQPYSRKTKLCGSILLPSVTVPERFHTLRIDEQKEVTFFAVVPLYGQEMDLKLHSGAEELLQRFGDLEISDIVDPSRPNVVTKRRW